MKTKTTRAPRQPAASTPGDAIVLPRGAATADEKLVDDAVSTVRAILGRTLARSMEEVGAYLLKTFYDNDPDLYASATPTKHASLRKLIEKCGTMELPVSATFLSSAIRVAIVSRRLPKDAAFSKLPISHRVELLRLPPENIEAAAQDVVHDETLTVRKLRAAVTKMLAKGAPRRGRPRTPPVVRAVNQIASALRKDDTWHLAFQRAELDELGEQERAELEATVERVTVLLGRLHKLLAKG